MVVRKTLGIPKRVTTRLQLTWLVPTKAFRQGVVFTNKEKGLWTPTENVTAEDIEHIQSRCEMFRCTHQLLKRGSRPSRGTIPQCRHHLAKWIYDACAAFDASQVLQSNLGAPAADAHVGDSPNVGDRSAATVVDLDLFMERAQLPLSVREAITRDVLAVGAVNVDELTKEDWEQLPTWQHLKPLEKRRVLRYAPPS